ncbi:MAG TPA: DinB family protein [Candidatus Acidoferrum sp.]|nr:DinB family protein [Candidatus Acidoferrum sp.]
MEIVTIEPFLKYFSGIRERTMRVARLVPPDKIDWSCGAGKFTLGDLLRHLAVTERYLWAENVEGGPSRYISHGKELAATYEEVIALMEKLHAESMEIFSRLTQADLQRKCRTPAGSEIQTAKWLRAMVEHEIHHRGQIYLYLGMLGVPTRPIFGLTSEQVRNAGVAD